MTHPVVVVVVVTAEEVEGVVKHFRYFKAPEKLSAQRTFTQLIGDHQDQPCTQRVIATTETEAGLSNENRMVVAIWSEPGDHWTWTIDVIVTSS